jgi:hypothetical protein
LSVESSSCANVARPPAARREVEIAFDAFRARRRRSTSRHVQSVQSANIVSAALTELAERRDHRRAVLTHLGAVIHAS